VTRQANRHSGRRGDAWAAALWLVLSALTLANANASVLAQNGYSFIDAEHFATRYAKRIDHAFRAVHLTAVEGKPIAAAYYGRFPAYSYWDGCSTAAGRD
jgi:hypothetical protein